MDPTFMMEKAVNVGTGMLMAIVIMVIGWIVSKWAAGLVRRAGTARKLDTALITFLANIASYTVLAMAAIAALAKVGIETTSITAIFASAGLAVGLALQGSLSNFASGVMILFFRPFTLGDVITAGGETGGVHDIGLFATTLINPNNHKIIVGNASIIGGNIINYTVLGKRRTTVEFGVAYGEDVDKIVALAIKAAKSCPAVIMDPAEPACAFTEMGASSINFAIHSWSETGDWLAAMHQVRTAIYNALNEAGIDIPYDQVVMHQAPTN